MDELSVVARVEGLEDVSQLHDRVALAFAQFVGINDQIKLEEAAIFLGKVKTHFQKEPRIYKQLLTALQNYQRPGSSIPDVKLLFSPVPELQKEFMRFLPEPSLPVKVVPAVELPSKYVSPRVAALNRIRGTLKAISPDHIDISSVRIENCVGFTQVPVGLAGPLSITGKNQNKTVYAPLATTEPTLVAACSRGCKAFQASGGIRATALSEGMSRAPMFGFSTVDDAVKFYQHVPSLETTFRASAEKTSRHAKLAGLQPHIIGSNVHIKFVFTCGDAAGQNMTTLATHHACQDWMKSPQAKAFNICDFQLEGQFASDKKMSWGNVQTPRGVRVLAWGTLTNDTCEKVLGCTTAKLHRGILRMNEGGVRNGHMGQNVNTANIMAAMFIACGQDVACVAESGWSQLTVELDSSSQVLTLSLYFPSMAVGTVGGGTNYPTQREALQLLGCAGSGKKHALAETIASFALALEASTMAAIVSDSFAQSHKSLGRDALRPRL